MPEIKNYTRVKKQSDKKSANRKRRPFLVVSAILVCVLLAGLLWAQDGHAPANPQQEIAIQEKTGTAFPEPQGEPQRIRVPAVDIDAPMTSISLPEDGVLKPPFDVAAWYNEGPMPGFRGPSVIVGHVDNKTGPNVFWNLNKMKAGDEVHVEYPGQTVTFVVTQTQTAPQNSLPKEQIWNKTNDQALRLVTCIGDFDHATREYSDNFIVYAKETGISNR